MDSKKQTNMIPQFHISSFTAVHAPTSCEPKASYRLLLDLGIVFFIYMASKFANTYFLIYHFHSINAKSEMLELFFKDGLNQEKLEKLPGNMPPLILINPDSSFANINVGRGKVDKLHITCFFLI